MKIRPSILWFCVAVIVVIAVLFLFHKKPVKTPFISPPTINSGGTGAPLNVIIRTNKQEAAVSGGLEKMEVMKKYRQGLISKGQAMQGILSSENDVPIVFYGKIEDQFGNAVANATVSFGVRVYNGYESTVKSGQTASDANGFFEISGYKGESLGIGVKKSGYVFVSMNGSGIYSKLYPEEQRAHPDPNNPTMIKMWKLQGAEPLVSIDKTFKLPYTDTPIFFDLVSGSIVPTGGDLEVVVQRAPGVITQRKQDHGDWSIKLVPVNGGIMEPPSSDIVLEAPEDDYQNSYFVEMKHDDPGWFDNIYRTFFMASRNRQVYSKFSLGFMINDDPNGTMWFQFKGVANTNGSRNWEATAPQ